MELSWPFLGLTDEYGRDIGWCGNVGPVHDQPQRDQLDELTRSPRVLGFTAYLRFPQWPALAGSLTVPEAWAHCFRSPEGLLPPGAPATFLPLSDFTDPSIVSPERLVSGTRHHFDFVYVCQPGLASEHVKGWSLAQRCLPVLVDKLGLRGLLVGRPQLPELAERVRAGQVVVTGVLPWAELMRRLATSRFLFVPNGLDPSPRVIAEALLMGTPVLVNRHILGGWHQVNPFTGHFFESEVDVAAGARRCLTEWTSPRRWFAAHLGPLRSGERLAALLREVDPDLPRLRRVHLSYRVPEPSPTAVA